MQHYKPTDAELEILHILWAQGPSTVRAGVILYGLSDIVGIFDHHPNPIAHYLFEELVFCRRYRDHAAADRLRRIALQISDSVPGAHQVLGNILAAARSPSHLGNLLAAQVLDPISLRQACLEEQHVATRLDTITDALGSALLHLMDDAETRDAH